MPSTTSQSKQSMNTKLKATKKRKRKQPPPPPTTNGNAKLPKSHLYLSNSNNSINSVESSPSNLPPPRTTKQKKRCDTISTKNYTTIVWNLLQDKGKTTITDICKELMAKIGMAYDSSMATKSSTKHKASNAKRNNHKAATKEIINEGVQQSSVYRRLYDILNVLDAIGAIQKDMNTREITWKGTFSPCGGGTITLLNELQTFQRQVEENERYLQELLMNYIHCRYLMSEHEELTPETETQSNIKVVLPFMLLNIPSDATVDIIIDQDASCLDLSCDTPFDIMPDTMIMKNLGLYVFHPIIV